MAGSRTTRDRTPLSREGVLRAAVALADQSGIESLTMRKLGQEVGVEAMSLYNHVANKDALLDGMVDLTSPSWPSSMSFNPAMTSATSTSTGST